MESDREQDEGLAQVLVTVRGRAQAADLSGRWPVDDLRDLAGAGALRWAVPSEFGGLGLDALDISRRYEQIAASSLAVALVVSQRDSAVGLIEGAAASPARAKLLTDAGAGCGWMTIGIAQLTTSRQGGAPALRAIAESGGYRLDGLIPWSTGAAESDFIIAGAVADAGQILFALPRDLPGVRVEAPLPLVALAASRTTAVRCDGALLAADLVLAGPIERVLGGTRRQVPLPQAFLATGLCQGGIDLIAEHDSNRARELHATFAAELAGVRQQVIAFCKAGPGQPPTAAPALRATCNDLALRITHATVALYKGSALLADHPAQRLAREALFLLVWSCPDPVIDCTVARLSAARPARANSAGAP